MSFTGEYAPIMGTKDARILPQEDETAILAAPPPFVGALLVTAAGAVRIAVGTSASSDWKTVTIT